MQQDEPRSLDAPSGTIAEAKDITTEQEGESQDNFVESKDPTELVMCIILSAAYAGLARFCWNLLQSTGNWRMLANVEGFFLTIGLLSMLVGLRPYLSPCSLQISHRGIKYRGPYWPQRTSVTWDQVFRLYLSPELIVILYHPSKKSKRIWPLIVQAIYLADRDRVEESISRYCPVPPVLLSNPSWISRLTLAAVFVLVVIWILQMLLGG